MILGFKAGWTWFQERFLCLTHGKRIGTGFFMEALAGFGNCDSRRKDEKEAGSADCHRLCKQPLLVGSSTVAWESQGSREEHVGCFPSSPNSLFFFLSPTYFYPLSSLCEVSLSSWLFLADYAGSPSSLVPGSLLIPVGCELGLSCSHLPIFRKKKKSAFPLPVCCIVNAVSILSIIRASLPNKHILRIQWSRLLLKASPNIYLPSFLLYS